MSMARVVVGSRVELQIGVLREAWRIVDPSEADATNRKMSAESALGVALVGRSAGDYCAVRAPGGTYGVTILDVG
jgi:transcription elongation factor GreA